MDVEVCVHDCALKFVIKNCNLNNAQVSLQGDTLFISGLGDQVQRRGSEVHREEIPERTVRINTSVWPSGGCFWQRVVRKGGGREIMQVSKLGKTVRQEVFVVNKLEDERERPRLHRLDSAWLQYYGDHGQEYNKRLTSERDELRRNWLRPRQIDRFTAPLRLWAGPQGWACFGRDLHSQICLGLPSSSFLTHYSSSIHVCCALKAKITPL